MSSSLKDDDQTKQPGVVLPAVATEGFHNASAYDSHRPSYPAEAVESLLEHLRILDEPNARVLELGAGTGKFTELLAARHEGFEIVAVEPHAEMRRQMEEKGLKNVKCVDGHAGKTGVEDGWGDACVVAQAFHWFATEETLRELQRVLKGSTVLGMIWNVEDYNKPEDWEAATSYGQKLNDLVLSLPDDGHPRFRHSKWQRVFEEQTSRSLNPWQLIKDTLHAHLPDFSLPLGEEKIPWTVWLSDDALFSRMSTLSQIANLGPQEKEEVRRKFDEILAGDGVSRNERGEVALHGVTYLAWTDRIGGEY